MFTSKEQQAEILDILEEELKDFEDDFGVDGKDASPQEMKLMIHLYQFLRQFSKIDKEVQAFSKKMPHIGSTFGELEPGLLFRIGGIPYRVIWSEVIGGSDIPLLNLKTNKIEYFSRDRSTDDIDRE